MRTRWTWIIAATWLALAAGAWAAEPSRVVDGNAWLKSSEPERRAFLLGAISMVSLETAHAAKSGARSPVAEQTARALEGISIDQLSARITQWYHANGYHRHVPVMAVVWRDLVQSSAAGSGASPGWKPK